LKASHTVSEVLWTLIQEKLDPQTIHNCSVACPNFGMGQIFWLSASNSIWFWSPHKKI